jgi:uncharacterized membrane protein
LLLALGMLLGEPGHAQPQYQVIELEPLPGLFPIAMTHDIGPAGQAVGRTWKNEGDQYQHHAVLWAPDGSATDLGEDGYWSEAFGISNTRYIAGRHDLPIGMRGALWDPSLQRMALGTLPEHLASEAYGVDDTGTPVGVSISQIGDRTAVCWDDNGVARMLPGANSASYALAVNGAGVAVGRRDVATAREAIVWEGDGFTILPDLGGGYASATNISENGTICGASLDGQSGFHAVLWDGATHEITILLTPEGGIYSQIEDVNDGGLAVGYVCYSIECDFASQRAVLWTGARPVLLNDQIPSGSGWTLFAAHAINEQGEIVGTGSREGYASIRAFKLTPEGGAGVEPAASSARATRFAPNPASGASLLSWTQPAAGSAMFEIHDVAGRSLAHRLLPQLAAGEQATPWSTLTGGRDLPAGLYFLDVTRGDGSSVRARVTVLR